MTPTNYQYVIQLPDGRYRTNAGNWTSDQAQAKIYRTLAAASSVISRLGLKALAIALSPPLPPAKQAIAQPKLEVPFVPQSSEEMAASSATPGTPPLVDYLKTVAASTAIGINRLCGGPHYKATVNELQEALDWYAAHPAGNIGNRGRIIWCKTRLLKLQMRVGLWNAEFQQVEDGFKILVTAPSGKSWTRLEKTDSLRDAREAFCTFAESWVNGNEPSSSDDLLGYPILQD